MNLWIYGPPASGKTTLGKFLAERLRLPFVDLDSEIEKSAGRPVKEIFAADGEAAFRSRERAALAAVAFGPASVVALGGGALLDSESRALAERTGEVLFLECDAETLRARAALQGDVRPLLNGDGDALSDLLSRRAAHYASFPRRVVRSFVLPSSVVLVGRGIAGVERFFAAPVRADVADANVAALGLAPDGAFALPAGEDAKSLDSVQSLWARFLSLGLARDGVVHSVGGGVPSDLAGFAAATWMRGVAWTSRPTTLLAMVDASTGGKTGFDFRAAKNQVGAFHPPSLVVADVDALASLPVREWRAGLAECVKHAFIADPDLLSSLDLFAPLAQLPPDAKFAPAPAALAAFVARSLAVKVEVVRADPFEKGARAKLNLGHTVGHAVESASGFALNHGEAVAIGTVEEARLAVRLGLAPADWPERVAAPFASVGLPTELPRGVSFDSLRERMLHDKKKSGSRIVFALPVAPGDVRLTPVDF